MTINNSELLCSFSPDDNFWKVNGLELQIPKAFKDIYQLDKGKSKSSKIMWAVALYADYSSKFFKLPHADKVLLICQDFIGDENFYKNNKKLFEDATIEYEKLQNNAIRKELSDWNKGMEVRNSTIRELETMIKDGYEVYEGYDEDDEEQEEPRTIKRRLDPKERLELMEKIDKFRSNTFKLYTDYKRILEEITKEESGNQTKGGSNPSMLELEEDDLDFKIELKEDN